MGLGQYALVTSDMGTEHLQIITAGYRSSNCTTKRFQRYSQWHGQLLNQKTFYLKYTTHRHTNKSAWDLKIWLRRTRTAETDLRRRHGLSLALSFCRVFCNRERGASQISSCPYRHNTDCVEDLSESSGHNSQIKREANVKCVWNMISDLSSSTWFGCQFPTRLPFVQGSMQPMFFLLVSMWTVFSAFVRLIQSRDQDYPHHPHHVWWMRVLVMRLTLWKSLAFSRLLAYDSWRLRDSFCCFTSSNWLYNLKPNRKFRHKPHLCWPIS